MIRLKFALCCLKDPSTSNNVPCLIQKKVTLEINIY